MKSYMSFLIFRVLKFISLTYFKFFYSKRIANSYLSTITNRNIQRKVFLIISNKLDLPLGHVYYLGVYDKNFFTNLLSKGDNIIECIFLAPKPFRYSTDDFGIVPAGYYYEAYLVDKYFIVILGNYDSNEYELIVKKEVIETTIYERDYLKII